MPHSLGLCAPNSATISSRVGPDGVGLGDGTVGDGDGDGALVVGLGGAFVVVDDTDGGIGAVADGVGAHAVGNTRPNPARTARRDGLTPRA